MDSSELLRHVAVLKGRHEKPSLRLRMRQGFVHFNRILEVGDSGVFFLGPSEDGGGAMEEAYFGSVALFEKGTVDLTRR